jgi:tRNA(Ile)-lysidine synthase
MQEISTALLRARADAQPHVQWPGGVVRRHAALLHAHRPGDTDPAAAWPVLTWHWRREPRLALPDGGALELCADPHGDLLLGALPERVTVHRRDAQPAAQAGARRALKRLLQELRLPPWGRAAVPLLYDGARLLAIADRWCAAGVRVRTDGAAAGGAGRAGAGPGRARGRLHWRAPI